MLEICQWKEPTAQQFQIEGTLLLYPITEFLLVLGAQTATFKRIWKSLGSLIQTILPLAIMQFPLCQPKSRKTWPKSPLTLKPRLSFSKEQHISLALPRLFFLVNKAFKFLNFKNQRKSKQKVLERKPTSSHLMLKLPVQITLGFQVSSFSQGASQQSPFALNGWFPV